MGVGALTDFGPMLRNLRLSIFGAAAQLGIFTVLLVAILMGFTPQEAGSLGIIGGQMDLQRSLQPLNSHLTY